MIFILNGRNNSIGGEKSWKNFVGNISEGVVKPEFLCLFIPWGVKWRGLLSGISSGFVFPDLVFLFCSNVCFPSIFGLDGVEAGFAPEKVFDVICWCLVKCDDSAKIVWKRVKNIWIIRANALIFATALREKHNSQRQVLKKFFWNFLLEKFGSLKKVLYLRTHFPTEKWEERRRARKRRSDEKQNRSK